MPPLEIPYECAKDQIINPVIYFPEFANYQIYKGNLRPERKQPGVLDAVKYVGNGVGSMANYVGQKYQEYDMNTKLINGGVATLKGVATVGKYLYHFTKPVVKYTSKKAVQGIGYLCKLAEEKMNESDENKEDEKETPEKKTPDNKNNKKENNNNNINTNDNKIEETNNTINNNSFCVLDCNNSNISESAKLKESCDLPTLELINMAGNNDNNNNNIYPNQNNDYYPNQNNNCYPDQNNNFYQDQNNNIYPNQNNNIYPNQNINNNNNITPEFVIPVGLESSSHEN